MATTALPVTTHYVDQNWFLEPLTGAQNPRNYLDSFPEEVYNVGPDSHLTRFMYALLGPSGVGFLRQNALEARLKLEELGLELYDLDAFYGEPLSFTRVTNELYDEDPRGLIGREAWDLIRARDARYRTRVLDFLDGARAGNTPTGMRYVARSGLGHEASIVENYKYLFDERSDDPQGLTYYGKTRFTEEMIVLPRREIPLSEVQVISIYGRPTGGTFTIHFRGETTAAIAWDASSANVQTFLEGLNGIEPGDVEVTGGFPTYTTWSNAVTYRRGAIVFHSGVFYISKRETLNDTPGAAPDDWGLYVFSDPTYRVRFMGKYLATDVPRLSTSNSLTGGTTPLIQTTVEQAGVDVADEIAYVSALDHNHLQEAVDRIRPQTVIPTLGEAPGLRSRQLWQKITATSEYDEVARYVTGAATVQWPSRDRTSWIEAGIEHESPKAFKDRQYQYMSYHKVQTVSSFTEEAIGDPDYGSTTTPDLMEQFKSNHVGPFSEFQVALFPVLDDPHTVQYLADMALADQPEPLTVRNIVEDEGTGQTVAQLINGMYPIYYADLPGVAPVKYDYEQFWASRERSEGDEYLEFDLGAVRGVNSVQFEITHKPVDIEISFDLLDQSPRRQFVPAKVDTSRSASLSRNFLPENQNPWQWVEYNFLNDNNELIFTRFIRIKFSRRNDSFSPFFVDGGDLGADGFYPWSIDVRNARVGRNVTNQ